MNVKLDNLYSIITSVGPFGPDLDLTWDLDLDLSLKSGLPIFISGI